VSLRLKFSSKNKGGRKGGHGTFCRKPEKRGEKKRCKMTALRERLGLNDPELGGRGRGVWKEKEKRTSSSKDLKV